jgi:hypothetical protein
VINEEESIDIYRSSFEYFQKLEKSIAAYLGLPKLKSGGVTIRNEKGWRENEKSIEYIWIVEMARSFVGWGGLFTIKFSKNEFREHSNEEELIQGVFISNDNEAVNFYTESLLGTSPEIINLFNLNLFDANKGITLDGVSYKVRIIAPNINTFINVHNPNTDSWKKWEAEIWKIGNRLAEDSNNIELKNLFEHQNN